ncbi:conserved hypothetical protein [delta proteobacterium NaphS2]|nr:conserved hypothetical protein [delta proteobacterium NaphS2]
MLPFKGVGPQKLGLARGGNKACIQCLDPGAYTGGGTVVFEIEKVSEPKTSNP